MSLKQLLQKIEAAIASLLVRRPKFTGSKSFEVNFRDGEIKDVVKTERSREH